MYDHLDGRMAGLKSWKASPKKFAVGLALEVLGLGLDSRAFLSGVLIFVSCLAMSLDWLGLWLTIYIVG